MKADKILFIDTETGGTDPASHSLLSLGLVVWKASEASSRPESGSSPGPIIATTEILINDNLQTTEKALAINNINLEKHSRKALAPDAAIQKIDKFLDDHFSKDEKITLGGHNINFDVNFLKSFFTRNNHSFENRFSHRSVDTSAILYYLYLSGKIKRKLTASQDAFDYFGITIDGRHTALGDALATAKLFSTLLSILDRRPKSRRPEPNDMPDLFTPQNQ